MGNRSSLGGFECDLRHDLLNGDIFYGMKEAQVLVNEWVQHYNTTRPHSALGYKPPAYALIYDADTLSENGTKMTAVHIRINLR